MTVSKYLTIFLKISYKFWWSFVFWNNWTIVYITFLIDFFKIIYHSYWAMTLFINLKARSIFLHDYFFIFLLAPESFFFTFLVPSNSLWELETHFLWKFRFWNCWFQTPDYVTNIQYHYICEEWQESKTQ